MSATLQQIRNALDQGFSGCLQYSKHSVHLFHGKLLSVSTDEDPMWLLRRLLCAGWITERFASELQSRQLPVDIRCFPMLTPDAWRQVLVDRTRQNLFDLSYLVEEPKMITHHEGQGALFDEHDTKSVLSEIERHSSRLAPLRNHAHQVWVQRLQEKVSHEIIMSCPVVFQLSTLLAQAPMEELDLLLEIEVLEAKGVIQTALNEADFSEVLPSQLTESRSEELQSESSDDALDALLAFDEPLLMTEAEQAMFADSDVDLNDGHYSVDKDKLDRVSLPSPEEQSQVYAMMTQANQLLRVMSQWVEASGMPPLDWLQELLLGESAAHAAFVESSAISESGEIYLKSAVDSTMAASALGSLLNRAARSPLAGEGRRTFLRAIDRWEQQWRS